MRIHLLTSNFQTYFSYRMHCSSSTLLNKLLKSHAQGVHSSPALSPIQDDGFLPPRSCLVTHQARAAVEAAQNHNRYSKLPQTKAALQLKQPAIDDHKQRLLLMPG